MAMHHSARHSSTLDEGMPCSQVNGEDLTPYRTASKRIWALLQRFGPVQRGGMDEAFVDVTAKVCWSVLS